MAAGDTTYHANQGHHHGDHGHTHHHGSEVPLYLAGALVLISLLSVAWWQWFGPQETVAPEPVAVQAERTLRFEDQNAGVVRVTDVGSGARLRDIAPGELGFVRGTLRGLSRARQARGIGPDAPFTLRQFENGRLLLIDTATGQEIDLWAFGSINANAFVELLHQAPWPESRSDQQPEQGLQQRPQQRSQQHSGTAGQPATTAEPAARHSTAGAATPSLE